MLRRILALVLLFTSLFALNVPPLQNRVNDHAQLLSAQEQQTIETLLAQYEQQTSAQFSVLIIPSLEGDNLEDFSIRTVEKWQLGQKGKNNGALLLIVKNERLVRIEVGYGLEPVLTDAFSGMLIRDILAPAFRDGNYAQGISDTLYAMMQKTGVELTTYTPQYTSTPSAEIPDFVVFIFILLLIFFAIKNPVFAAYLLSSMLSGGRGGSSFGGFSGGGGSFGGGGASGRW